jgi:multidrug resistance efflux pump
MTDENNKLEIVREEAKADYPPETVRFMSWNAVQFINSPTSYMLDLTCATLIAAFIGCLVLGRILHLDVSVTGPAEVTVEGGIREIVSPIDGLVTKVFKKNGDVVKNKELIARLQMDEESSNEIQKASAEIADLTKKAEVASEPVNLVTPSGFHRFKIYDAAVLQALANVEHSIHDFQLAKDQALALTIGRRIAQASGDATGTEIYYANKRIQFLTNRLDKMKASPQRRLLASYIDSTEEELGRLKTQVTTAKLKANSTLDLAFADLLRNLRVATGILDDYTERHEIRSPVAGVIGKIIDGDNVHMTTNRSIATVIPTNSQFITRIQMKSKDIVRLKKGQRVYYKVEAYPFQRYGLFSGEIIDFEQLKDNGTDGHTGSTDAKPNDDDVYLLHATIEPPEHLDPDLKEQIKFIFGMRAEATVIMDRKSINEIIFEKFFNMKDL